MSLHPMLMEFNKQIGAIRFKVGKAFGTMNRRLHLARITYFGTAKVQVQMCWALLAKKLLKARRTLKVMEAAGAAVCLY